MEEWFLIAFFSKVYTFLIDYRMHLTCKTLHLILILYNIYITIQSCSMSWITVCGVTLWIVWRNQQITVPGFRQAWVPRLLKPMCTVFSLQGFSLLEPIMSFDSRKFKLDPSTVLTKWQNQVHLERMQKDPPDLAGVEHFKWHTMSAGEKFGQCGWRMHSDWWAGKQAYSTWLEG